MKIKKNKITLALTIIAISAMFIKCSEPTKSNQEKDDTDKFVWKTEQFADLKIIRYQIPGWENLTPKQRTLVYYLTQAGYEGRDIIWDQNYRFNLEIRKALEKIVTEYNGEKESEDWKNFMIYTKRVWFSSGIHHHYSNDKILPEFSKQYFKSLLKAVNTELNEEILEVIFNPEIDNKKVNLDPSKDLLLASATNFYDPNVSEKEVEKFYKKKQKHINKEEPISLGLNSKIIKKEDGTLEELVWKKDGLYGKAIEKIIYWLEKAVEVAENEPQANALKLLIEYYTTGDLDTWDKYNVAWAKAIEGDIDYINSFIEVYNDPLGYRGSYESIIQIKNFEASKRMKVLMDNVQWFEDNSTIQKEHKKEKVVGVTYKVVNVAGECGDASPSTPIGVNLPNANWIRVQHGSKSVSLGNIIDAYKKASNGGFTAEFSLTEEAVKRSKKYGSLAGKLHTALHEVVGHASGKINAGIGTPKETLKNYASTLEEGRADLVALYYLLDPKLIEFGLMETLEVGKAEYDSYIRNGLMTQLIRIELGNVIEEAHMRNRQMIAKWVFEKGKNDNVVEKVIKEGKTYFRINDYEKLRILFGQLLNEVQRIKSEGDYKAGRNLVENYGVQIDLELHKEVLERSKKLNKAPYGGFINPKLEPVLEGDKIIDVKVTYPDDFTKQMLYYSKEYGNL